MIRYGKYNEEQQYLTRWRVKREVGRGDESGILGVMDNPQQTLFLVSADQLITFEFHTKGYNK